jgi:hypothetical protein
MLPAEGSNAGGGMALRRTLKLHVRFGRIVALAAMFFFAAAAGAKAGSLSIELNKLEPQKESCRAYVVVTNNSSTVYQALKLDLVLFQPDGVIGRRFALDLGPVKAQKRSVKLFDLDTPCDQVGSLLINDVLECNGETGSIPNCLADLSATSLAKAKLTK